MSSEVSAVTIPDPMLLPLRDDGFLIQLLTELTGEPADRVRLRFEREQRELGINVRESFAEWGLQPFQWTEQLGEFYSRTDAFLFETLVWNRHPVKGRMRRWIAEFLQRDNARSRKILTFGDGLGIDSLYLAMAGHQVDYFEVSEKCVRFANRLTERVKQPLRIVASPEAIEQEAYDVVVCLDVLEHLPDPPATVRQLAGYLKLGGRLIVHAPFWYIHPAVVTHLASNCRYSGDLRRLYHPHGLRLIDGGFFWAPIVLEKAAGTNRRTRQRPSKAVALAFSGCLLTVARYWRWPHATIWQCLARC